MKKKRTRLEDLVPDPEIRERVVKHLYSREPLLGKGSVFSEMLQAMVNTMLEAEMDGFMQDQADRDDGLSNRRNGHIHKTLRSAEGPIEIKTPRDRLGAHEPILVPKRSRELNTGLDNAIISLYARGNSVSDIRKQVHEIYGLELSEGMISSITNKVYDQVTEWQQRPLDACYTIIYLDAIHYRTREERQSVQRAVYTIYGVNAHGDRDVLGLYIAESEGARQWGLILEDLRRRGVETIFFCCVDGLKGFKEAILEVFPMALVQRCIVHMVRRSTRFVSYKDLKAVCADLRKIYTAANRELAQQNLELFARKWSDKYKSIAEEWERDFDDLMVFMDYKQAIRRLIYTTNPVEAVHRVLRKVTKTKGTWPNDQSLIKQLFLALQYNESSWKRKAYGWTNIQQDLIDCFGAQYLKYAEA
ncbi:MAG: IS256 family transposase [Methanothrix sp.]|nr:IS256 family transposase [Methanothrix sp.]